MGTLSKIAEWASGGTKTEPSTLKQLTGWLVREKPPASWFNWLINSRDAKINQLVDAVARAEGGMPAHVTADQIGRPFPFGGGGATHDPKSPVNTCQPYSEADITDACVGWDASIGAPRLFITGPNTFDGSDVGVIKSIPCWDYSSSMDSLVEDLEVHPGWTSASHTVGNPICCADGYLWMANRRASSPTGLYLQKYAITPWTGIPVISVAWTTDNIGLLTDLVEADADTMALAYRYGTDIRLRTMSKDGLTGAVVSDSSHEYDYLCRSLPSDGINLFVSMARTDEGFEYSRISRYDIATLAGVLIEAEQWPTDSGAWVVASMCALGSGNVAAYENCPGDLVLGPRVVVYGDYTSHPLWRLAVLEIGTPDQGITLARGGCLGYDGANLYLTYQRIEDGYSDDQHYIALSGERLPWVIAGTAMDPTPITENLAYNGLVSKPPRLCSSDNHESLSYRSTFMVFDSSDMWTITAYNRGNICRLTAPNKRR